MATIRLDNKDIKPSELNLIFFETKRGHEHTPRLISKTTTEDYDEFLIADEPTKDEEFFFKGFQTSPDQEGLTFFWLRTSPRDDHPRFQTST